MRRKIFGQAVSSSLIVFVAGCGGAGFETSDKHITVEQAKAEAPVEQRNLPKLVKRTPVLPKRVGGSGSEKFDVVVTDIPARDLLFALARDAGVNMDIDVNVGGVVSISAIDQTLDAILQRIAEQANLRIEREADVIKVVPDRSYFAYYQVDYLNISRSGSTSASSGGVSGIGSSSISATTENDFWGDLESGLAQILGVGVESEDADSDGLSPGRNGGRLDAAQDTAVSYEQDISYTVIANSGLVIVYAPRKLQNEVAEYLSRVGDVSTRQVLLEATVVEVILNDTFSSGIDWGVFKTGKVGYTQGVNPANPAAVIDGRGAVIPAEIGAVPPFASFAVSHQNLTGAVSLLETFGEARVLSSPRISTLNNQMALLKVVDQEVYFDLEIETEEDDNGNETRTITYEEQTVDVGFVMSVVPQISEDGQVMLSLKPSVTRVVGRVQSPAATTGDVTTVPIVRTRELESLVRLEDGGIAVLGGLLEDRTDDVTSGIPGVTQIPAFGDLFSDVNKNSYKTEFVVFIKATVVTNPTVHGDYSDYIDLLPDAEFLHRDQGLHLLPGDQKKGRN